MIVVSLAVKLMNSELDNLKDESGGKGAEFLNKAVDMWYKKAPSPACWETIHDALWKLPNRPLADKVIRVHERLVSGLIVTKGVELLAVCTGCDQTPPPLDRNCHCYSFYTFNSTCFYFFLNKYFKNTNVETKAHSIN